MLNLFSYSGAFALPAGAARPASEIVNVDSSQSALDLAQRIVQQNDDHLDVSRFDYVNANVFDKLRDAALHGQSFDVVVLDPPKFAHNKGQVEKAARGYKDLNLNAFKLVRPGGFLLTFSCSGSVSRDLFQKIVFGALADSGRTAQIIRHLSAGDDHPSALTFPEGDYLKGLLLRVY
jgi:23S rRNA (cytosine1962-C5)-methyltransferase